MRNLKKMLAVIVAICVLATFCIPAFAEEVKTDADVCEGLGMIQGTGDGVTAEYLATQPDRLQAAILFLRLKGLEGDAKAFTGTDNFNDVSGLNATNQAITAYLKAHPELGYEGIPGGGFDPLTKMTAKAYYKVILVALGYTYGDGKDFTWANVLSFAASKGLSKNIDLDTITVNDLAIATVEGLKAFVKGSTTDTLAVKMVKDGVINEPTAAAYGLYTVPVVALAVDNVSATNYKEAVVKFNKVVDATKGADKANYAVTGNTVTKATVAADKLSVTLTLGTAIAPQGNMEVTVKKALGLAADATNKITGVIDSTIPKVDSVVAKGNKKLTVTFSEPVQSTNLINNYKIDGLYFGTSGSITIDDTGRVVSIPLATALAAGSHKLTVTGVTDYANYTVLPDATDFAVATDADAATVTFVSATQTSLKVKFSKPVIAPAAADISVASGATVGTVSLDADDQTLTVTFSNSSPLPATGSTDVTFKNVTTLFGVKAADLKLTVTTTPDLVRPEVTDVAAQADGQGYILVTFNKNVLVRHSNTSPVVAEYVLKNSSGTTVAVNAAYNTTSTGSSIKTQVKLTPVAPATTFAAGTYTLTIQGVVDDNPLYNQMLTVIKSVTVADKIAPTIAKAIKDTTNNKLYVEFSEAVDATLAVTKANYMYTTSSGIFNLNADTTLTLLADGKTVAIDVKPKPSATGAIDVAGISAVQVQAVADTAGNVMTTQAVSTFDTTSSYPAPAISSATITGPNTIEVVLSQKIVDANKNINDFVIQNTYSTPARIYAINIVYTDSSKKITLTTNETLAADGTYQGYPVIVKTAAATTTSDVYGQKLVVDTTGVSAVDKIAPAATVASATYDTASGNTVVTVNFSENLAGSGTSNAVDSSADFSGFYVYANGVAQTATAAYSAASGSTPAKVTLTFAGSFVGKTVRVAYLVPVTPALKDASQAYSTANALAAFDQTVTGN